SLSPPSPVDSDPSPTSMGVPGDDATRGAEFDDEGSSAESASSMSVVVGGSVGGLAVLLEILDRLPDGLDMALIYVPHQETRSDGLPARLAAHTPMPVIVVDQKTPIVPGHLYVPH